MIPLLTGAHAAYLAETVRWRVKVAQDAAERRTGVRPSVRADIADMLVALDTCAEAWRHSVSGHADTAGAGSGKPSAGASEMGTADAGRLLGVDERTVRRLFGRSELPGRRDRGRILIRRDDALRLKEQRDRPANA